MEAEFASQVRAIIKQLRENKELRGVVFVSAKPDNFTFDQQANAGAGSNAFKNTGENFDLIRLAALGGIARPPR